MKQLLNPHPRELIQARYSVRINKSYKFEEAMEILATETSIGIESLALQDRVAIFPGISNLSSELSARHEASFQVIDRQDKYTGLVDIGYPVENIKQDNGTVNILLSTLMGDIFGIDVVSDIRLQSVSYPNSYLALFTGPKFGIKGIADKLGNCFPKLGVIIKPNIGLTAKEVGKLAYDLALGGAEFIKDDELCSSPHSCPVFERLGYVMDALKKAEQITGKTCLYALNVTSDGSKTLQVAREAVRRGANCLMLNLIMCGYDVLKEISEDDQISVPIHTHRCMHDIFTSRPNYGISLSVLADLARICGADFFHIGTPVGKTDSTNMVIREALDVLTKKSNRFAATVPVTSRSSVLSIEKTVKLLGSTDLLFLSCGGIYRTGVPLQNAVRAIVESINFHINGIDVRSDNYYTARQYAETLENKSQSERNDNK